MRHKLRFRWAVVGLAILASLWYLWPTYRLYSMAPAERDALQEEDPDAWERLREGAIQLGLDLQGGMHLVLELDESERTFTGEERSDAIARALEIIRNRVNQFGVLEPLIQGVGDERIIVELPGVQDEERAKELVQRTAFLEFQIVVGEAAATEQIRALDAALADAGPDSLAESLPGAADTTAAVSAPLDPAAADTVGADTARQTLGEFLGDEDTTAAGGDSLAVPLDRPLSSRLQSLPTGITGQTDFLVAEDAVARVRAMLERPEAQSALDPAYEWLWGSGAKTFSDGESYASLYLVEKESQLTGEAIASAAAGFDTQFTNQTIVTLQMTDDGANRFAEVTGDHVNERLAIVLDEVVRMAPNVRQRITGGNAQIEGFDSVEEGRDIAIVLRAGALPAPLQIIEERTIGPSLGADSIQKSQRAGLVGMLAVIIFMVIIYRASGVVATVGMALNLVLILAALAAFGATLTLPGIAGLILTIGMAVDANVLIFERIREELDVGKSVRAAIEAGYDRAFVTILDSQITTLIAAVVLFQFGTGPIKGFAVVLTIGIITSIFTAVFVTRTFYETWTRHRPARSVSI
ncbi:MAG: protein translocase subunit SecD [Gemmatimonadota bacterium]